MLKKKVDECDSHEVVPNREFFLLSVSMKLCETLPLKGHTITIMQGFVGLGISSLIYSLPI